MPFQVGDRVNRIEDREVTGAVVITVVIRPDGNVYEIQYDEGGSGWWPESALAAAT
jgi:hypothetical protein